MLSIAHLLRSYENPDYSDDLLNGNYQDAVEQIADIYIHDACGFSEDFPESVENEVRSLY